VYALLLLSAVAIFSARIVVIAFISFTQVISIVFALWAGRNKQFLLRSAGKQPSDITETKRYVLTTVMHSFSGKCSPLPRLDLHFVLHPGLTLHAVMLRHEEKIASVFLSVRSRKMWSVTATGKWLGTYHWQKSLSP